MRTIHRPLEGFSHKHQEDKPRKWAKGPGGTKRILRVSHSWGEPGACVPYGHKELQGSQWLHLKDLEIS